MANQHIKVKQVESNDNEEKTFLQLILTFPFIGEYITTFIALIPAILIYWLKIFPENEKWEAIAVGSISFLWVILMEKKGKVKLCTPHLPIPIKWLLIPFTLIMFFS